MAPSTGKNAWRESTRFISIGLLIGNNYNNYWTKLKVVVLYLLVNDKRAHLNEHMEASVGDHLKMTWSSLVQTKQDLSTIKHWQQKMVKLVGYCRDQNQNLSQEVKTLKDEYIEQGKWIENMVRKTPKEIKSVESKVLARTRDSAVSERPKKYARHTPTRPVPLEQREEVVDPDIFW